MRRKCLPEVFEEDALAALDQFERNWTVHEMEMPECRSCVNLFPDVADPWNGRFEQRQFFDVVRILSGVCIGHHQPDVVTHKIDFLHSEALHEFMNIGSYCLFIVTPRRS